MTVKQARSERLNAWLDSCLAGRSTPRYNVAHGVVDRALTASGSSEDDAEDQSTLALEDEETLFDAAQSIVVCELSRGREIGIRTAVNTPESHLFSLRLEHPAMTSISKHPTSVRRHKWRGLSTAECSLKTSNCCCKFGA